MATDFEKYHAMLVQMNQEESAAQEARLVDEGTWTTILESFQPIDVDRLPNAEVRGYRLTFNVDQNGATKKHWVNVYMTPVSNAKGLVLQSKLGAQLAKALDMNPDESYEDLLNRAKGTPLLQRIGKKPASGGFKASNTTWAITRP